METHVHTPQVIFNLPQRLVVPLFQRRYVWDLESQWQPLWEDVERVAEKVLNNDFGARHFLGAVVLQQEANSTGTMLSRTIIDGQQRLTTLQLLFDSIYEEILRAGQPDTARRMADLVENPEHQRREPEDRFKVWPTNHDRDAFAEVMATPAPAHSTLRLAKERIVQAHRFFSESAREWLHKADPADVPQRATALVDAVATRLQIVVIDLKADEDAQEIFETLNARGTPLSAADLIKNLVFQRLKASPEDSEKAYHRFWQQFETAFWEEEVSSGRVLWSRSSLFLTQWLTSQTRREIPAREVFASFKRHLDDSGVDILATLEHIKACADVYQAVMESSEERHGPLSELALFTYRTRTMQSEVIRPLVIWLTDPTLEPIPSAQLNKALQSVESWLVRRMLVRETSKAYNRFVIDIIQACDEGHRANAGDTISAFLAAQTADSQYLPDDQSVRESLETLAIYRRITRGRLRMVLEAIEDHRRGFPAPNARGEAPVVRQQCTIEHLMPRAWAAHWPLPAEVEVSERDALVHTLGNLTLVSKALNPSMSNAAWRGPKGKRSELQKYSSILVTADAIKMADANDGMWSEDLIEARTQEMIDAILEIWPAPLGHTNANRLVSEGSGGTVTVKDLIDAGLLEVGAVLRTRHGRFPDAVAIVEGDGRISVNGKSYDTPSGAGKAATVKRAVNGWGFWRVGSADGPSLRNLRAQLAGVAPEASLEDDLDDDHISDEAG